MVKKLCARELLLSAGSRVMQVKFYRVYEKQSIWQQKRQRIAKALDQRHHMLKYPSCHRLCGRTKVVFCEAEVQQLSICEPNTALTTFVWLLDGMSSQQIESTGEHHFLHPTITCLC